jgi:hypothetical protein
MSGNYENNYYPLCEFSSPLIGISIIFEFGDCSFYLIASSVTNIAMESHIKNAFHKSVCVAYETDPFEIFLFHWCRILSVD